MTKSLDDGEHLCSILLNVFKVGVHNTLQVLNSKYKTWSAVVCYYILLHVLALCCYLIESVFTIILLRRRFT